MRDVADFVEREELPDVPSAVTRTTALPETDSIREQLAAVPNKQARQHIARNWISDQRFKLDKSWD